MPHVEGMNLGEYLNHAGEQLSSGPEASPRLEAEVLIRHSLAITREQFFAELQRQLTPPETVALDALVARRASGEPLAYITGYREFYSLDFTVNGHVLIPRQETELLVDLALEFADSLTDKDISIVDVGTGSGAIAIALAHHLPDARVYAVDVDENAIAVANANCLRNDLADRVELLQGDLMGPIQRPVDVIVSNPPYIPSEEILSLAVEVQREPRQALDGGPDGLDVFRRLLKQAPAKLKAGGIMLVELSPQQMEQAEQLAKAEFTSADVSHADDLLGLARVLIIKTR